MTTLFILVFLVYSVGVLVLAFGWARLSDNVKNQVVVKDRFISVIVPFRNEQENIYLLLKSLRLQSYQQNQFEVILVNDHSQDDSLRIAQENNTDILFKILSLPDGLEGKKTALNFGIGYARGEVIATTDADCVVPQRWLEKINDHFQSTETKMVVGPVKLSSQNSLFSKMQALEFLSLIGTAGSTIGLGKPTMCNGANLSFLKSAYEKVNGYKGNEEIPSGDDEFLMRKIQTQGKNSIRFLNESQAVVTTTPQISLVSFIQQRLRWAGKWKHNSSIFTQSVALAILFLNMSFILFFGWALSGSLAWQTATALWILKMFSEIIFLLPVSSLLSNRWHWLSFFALQFVYPFYVVFIGVLSQIKGYHWKGRDWK